MYSLKLTTLGGSYVHERFYDDGTTWQQFLPISPQQETILDTALFMKYNYQLLQNSYLDIEKIYRVHISTLQAYDSEKPLNFYQLSTSSFSRVCDMVSNEHKEAWYPGSRLSQPAQQLKLSRRLLSIQNKHLPVISGLRSTISQSIHATRPRLLSLLDHKTHHTIHLLPKFRRSITKHKRRTFGSTNQPNNAINHPCPSIKYFHTYRAASSFLKRNLRLPQRKLRPFSIASEAYGSKLGKLYGVLHAQHLVP